MGKGYVYILECSDGSYYTGSTIDLAKRFDQHQSGLGANHTKKRLPVRLVFAEEFTAIEEAFKRGKQIQGWSREKKEALIEKEYEKLPALSIAYRDIQNKVKVSSRTSDTETQKNAKSTKVLPEALEGEKHTKKSFYSNGKLLLTGEYFVLDGAKSLAVPTTCGQDLTVQELKEPQLIWKSFTNEGECWLEAIFDLPKLRLFSADFDADEDGGNDMLAENLLQILKEVRNFNPEFLNTNKGFLVETHLSFPKNWGLGTSSTLINNLANWAKVNPYQLLENTFGGSGYDLACAEHNTPILYTKNEISPVVEKVDFNPSFKEQLYFVYLNKKQNSREGIQRFKALKGNLTSEIKAISDLTNLFVNCTNLTDFEKLMQEHEQLVSKTIQLKTVQEQYFSDYFGQTKSLGAWGGDFILATGNEDSPSYFKQKGFHTVIPYQDLIL